MALCSSSVLTGQEGPITFKPPGTSVCVRDWSAFGTDGDESHITLECGSDFRVGDIITFTEENGGNLDGALSLERLVSSLWELAPSPLAP